MGLTFKQITTTTITSGTSATVTPTNNLTSGSLILVCVDIVGELSGTFTVADNGGNGSYTQVGTTQNNGSNSFLLFACLSNVSTGKPTITLSSSVSAILVFYACEYTGQAASSPIDTFVFNFSQSTTTSTVSVSTGAFTNESIIGIGINSTTTSSTANTNFTLRSPATNANSALTDYLAPTTPGTFTPGQTGITGGWVLFGISVKSITSTPVSSGIPGALTLLGVGAT